MNNIHNLKIRIPKEIDPTYPKPPPPPHPIKNITPSFTIKKKNKCCIIM